MSESPLLSEAGKLTLKGPLIHSDSRPTSLVYHARLSSILGRLTTKHQLHSAEAEYRADAKAPGQDFRLKSNTLGEGIEDEKWGGRLDTLTDAPRPLSRSVRNSLVFKTPDSIVVEESKPIVRLTVGFRQQERCHRACNQLKIPSIELGLFSLGIEILWLANGCEILGLQWLSIGNKNKNEIKIDLMMIRVLGLGLKYNLSL
ncbi:hypothetical protein PIB30_077799 [Stylosanthes scabra]|uniref:Uncharacterized protein n=1 Tax=Stylosanthes scabra TaxID=79078 RepID=A0ABU6VRV9_9FABA|nr:hypothetical protein [Stylosanthes scabra]